MPAYKNIALVGASGNIGSIILKGLIDASIFNITVLSRKESDATFPAGVTVKKTDFSVDELAQALQGQDAVISTVGAAAFDQQKKLVDASLRAGVKRFFPSEFSASSQDKAVQQLLPLFATKAELIDYLRSKESEGFSWTGIATSGLFDWGLANGFLQFDIKNRTATIWDDGNKRFTLINQKAMGKAVVSALKNPEGTRNQFLYAASVETSQNEIVAALEKATGEKWNVTKTTTKEQLDDAEKRLSAGDYEGAVTLVRATVYGNLPGMHANYAKEETLANELLGLGSALENVEEVAKRVAAN